MSDRTHKNVTRVCTTHWHEQMCKVAVLSYGRIYWVTYKSDPEKCLIYTFCSKKCVLLLLRLEPIPLKTATILAQFLVVFFCFSLRNKEETGNYNCEHHWTVFLEATLYFEANESSDKNAPLRQLRNPKKVHLRVHKSSPLDSNQIQIKPVHIHIPSVSV